MTQVFYNTHYRELAQAVNKGMPMSEAEKIISKQRTIGGRGEQYFWLELDKVAE